MVMSDLTTDTVSAMIEEAFPEGFATGRRSRVPEEALVLETGPLTIEHVNIAMTHVESGATMGVTNNPIKAIRNTHHRLAQLLALGMDETKASVLCNYAIGRVSILKSDPAFQDLLAYYTSNVEAEMMEFVSAAKELSLDFLGKLQQDLDESPEKFTPQLTLEAIRTLADRTGHAPVSKTVNVNVNAEFGDRLAAARRRVSEAQFRDVTPAALSDAT
jgi:hypothetical protein